MWLSNGIVMYPGPEINGQGFYLLRRKNIAAVPHVSRSLTGHSIAPELLHTDTGL